MLDTITGLSQIWKRTLDNFRDQIDQNVFEVFLSDSYVYQLNGNQIVVALNSSTAVAFLTNDSFFHPLTEALRTVSQSNYDLKLVSKTDLPKEEKKEELEQKKDTFFANSVLKPSFTFDSFVVGSCNREAYQASLMIAANPGKFFNPLFLYSQSGLGKTHLLHAIGNYVKKNQPKSKVLYITSDDFVDEFVRYARGNNDGEDLKSYFRSVDVLLVDDIQFLAGKTKTEEMFFFVFNTLINMNKQIVLTSDRQPSELNGLEERLVTRFSQGLNLSIQRPDKETLTEILKKKIVAYGLPLEHFDENVLQFLAEKYGNNVRELEGSLNRLQFYAINMKSANHIPLELALEALADTKDAKAKVDEERIIHVVSDYYNLTPSQLTGKIRSSQISMARHIAIYLCRTILDVPFKKIGQTFGGKDHSTIMSAVKKVETELKTNPHMVEAISELKKRLSTE